MVKNERKRKEYLRKKKGGGGVEGEVRGKKNQSEKIDGLMDE